MLERKRNQCLCYHCPSMVPSIKIILQHRLSKLKGGTEKYPMITPPYIFSRGNTQILSVLLIKIDGDQNSACEPHLKQWDHNQASTYTFLILFEGNLVTFIRRKGEGRWQNN